MYTCYNNKQIPLQKETFCMQKWTNQLTLDKKNSLVEHVFTEHTIFFDIETTGFSPTTTQLYLIGCAIRTQDTMIIEQFFAESKEDEINILKHFTKLLEPYQTIITFNGIGFDIPYLKAKCKSYGISECFDSKEYIDLFKIASSLKFLLKLENYKQKTVETFLGIHRNDTFNGGELIQVYQSYILHPNEHQMFFLKQHNYEDVLGMLDLLPILAYDSLLKGGYTLSSVESNIFTDYEGIEQKELIFTLKNNITIPKRVSYGYHEFYLICNGDESKLSVRLYDGTLKYFFPNYKDYYYLPEEDIAIHKDVAEGVSKAYRKKATASTCYTKKTSIFLPQYSPVTEPAFYLKHKDKISYFELLENFVSSNDLMQSYVDYILMFLAKQKY